MKAPITLLVLLPLALAKPTPADFRKPIPKPINADSAWLAIKRCAAKLGVREYPGGELKDVKWFETTEWEAEEVIGSTPYADYVALGRWIPPDTILLARRVRMGGGRYRGWSIAHELLHHLLRGPPSGQHLDPHPYVPFAAPCELMAWQHVGEWERQPFKAFINSTTAP